MATYYVRKTGNDTNDGLTPAAAFLTIDKAANTVAAGDVVHIGAGLYRELVTMDTSGTAEAQITFAADITGAYTGDAGLVIISAFDTDTDAPSRASCLDWNGKEFVTWRGVTFTGGTGAVIISDNGDVAHEGDVLEDCAVTASGSGVSSSAVTTMHLDFNRASTPATQGLTMRRCVIAGRISMLYNYSNTAETDLKARVENCVFVGNGLAGTSCIGLSFIRGMTGTYPVGGVTVTGCTFMGLTYGVYTQYFGSTSYPVSVTNCLFMRLNNSSMASLQSLNDASIVSDYNRFYQVPSNTIYNGVTAGANDDSTGDFGMLGGIADWPLYRFWGWSPFLPWEPVTGISGYTNPLVGAASSTATEDAYGNPRPMGRNTRDIGAVEARTRPVDETTTVHGGSHAAKFSGAGFYETFVPVSAAETTISVYAYKDASYTGDAPIMEVFNIPGVADQSDAMAGAAEAWEQLSCTFTPTSAGLVRVRLRSRDTSATGECIFDDLTVA